MLGRPSLCSASSRASGGRSRAPNWPCKHGSGGPRAWGWRAGAGAAGAVDQEGRWGERGGISVVCMLGGGVGKDYREQTFPL